MKQLLLIVEALRLVASIIKSIKGFIEGLRVKRVQNKIKQRKKQLTDIEKVSVTGQTKENDEKLKKLFRKLHNISSS